MNIDRFYSAFFSFFIYDVGVYRYVSYESDRLVAMF